MMVPQGGPGVAWVGRTSIIIQLTQYHSDQGSGRWGHTRPSSHHSSILLWDQAEPRFHLPSSRLPRGLKIPQRAARTPILGPARIMSHVRRSLKPLRSPSPSMTARQSHLNRRVLEHPICIKASRMRLPRKPGMASMDRSHWANGSRISGVSYLSTPFTDCRNS